ncbi:TPA: hypothetical protein N0F65_000834 [Lagenidium giganteum]|uniref:Uncharacterized protein n=1 Tax=Lagenidium giganteum TaxID=4803 RepID=A0AAV2Z1N2_9STRA|nr:TPA: hypothetical protein N0F65_000834 [Lagenidium giganteum]
MSSASTMSMK